ncbi:hypothetical protein OG21DRAFT_1525023 [Imleria badia]|nr:hypothetical protein OG21DRAFT_1525023 [Imleria badia]
MADAANVMVEEYFGTCEQYRLSGISHPFFWDWPLSCPARFLTPECLHYWHRFFWDHNLQWCKHALGARELDFRFSILPPITGLHHFSEGVTQLKQVTGRTHRDAQRYIIVVLSGYCDTHVVTAIRALMDFRYLAQAPVISSTTRDKIATALATIHQHKQAILDHGLRRRPQTNAPLEHFNIPKLEMMHNVVPSVSNVGSILQWTADTTEHAHIEVVKNPAAMTNNMNYNAQICCTLDHDEKCRLFNIAISLSQQYKDMENGGDADQELDADADADADDEIDDGMDDNDNLAGELWSESPHRQTTNLFAVAQRLLEAAPGAIPRPLRVFVSSSTTFHLNREPSIRRVSIDDAAQKFNIPDLSPQDVPLSFNELCIWYKVRLQQKSYHDLSTLGLAFTVHAHPPDQTWKYGHYSGALLNVDEAHAWPSSSLAGHSVVLVRMVMCPALRRKQECPWMNRPLVYAERLNIVTQANRSVVELSSGLHVLKRATRASGVPLVAVVEILWLFKLIGDLSRRLPLAPTVPDPPQLSEPPPRRSKRATAGQGGYTDQLEKVGAAIETPAARQPPRRHANLSDDEPVNIMTLAPPVRRPQRKASQRPDKGSEDKSLATPPSQLVPMVETTMPVSVPAVPDSHFSYQVLPSAPMKVTRPMTSAEGKTSGTAQVASGPDPRPTCTVQPPRSSGLRSNTPLAAPSSAPSSHHIPHVSPQLHTGDQRPQSHQSVETHHVQLTPSNDSHSSPLTDEDSEDEKEEKEEDDRLEEEEENDDDEEKGWDEQDGEHRIQDVPVQDKDEHMSDDLAPHGGTSTQVTALAVPEEHTFDGDDDNTPASSQAVRRDS